MPDYQKIKIGPFNKALNNGDGFAYGNDWLMYPVNVVLDTQGNVHRRGGYTNMTTSSHASFGTTIWNLFTHVDSAGSEDFIVWTSNRKLYYGSSPAALTSEYDPSWSFVYDVSSAMFDYTLYLTPDYYATTKAPIKYNGTSFSSLTALGSTGGTGFYLGKALLAEHDRMFVGGITENNATDDEFPNRIRFSNLSAPETWTNTDYIDLNPDDGGYIVRLISFQGSILILRQRSIYVLTGRDSEAFNVYRVSSEYGLSSRFGWTVVNDVLYFYDHRHGVVKFDGEEFEVITESNGDPLITLDSASDDVAMFVDKQHLFISYWSGAGTYLDKSWVYHLDSGVITVANFGFHARVKGKGSTYAGINFIGQVTPLQDSTDQKRIFKYDRSADEDDGVEFRPQWATGWITAENNEKFTVEKIELYYDADYNAATSAANNLFKIWAYLDGSEQKQSAITIAVSGYPEVNGSTKWHRLVLPYDFSEVDSATVTLDKWTSTKGISSIAFEFSADITTRTVPSYGIAGIILTIKILPGEKEELYQSVTTS